MIVAQMFKSVAVMPGYLFWAPSLAGLGRARVIISSTNWRILPRLTVMRITLSALFWMHLSGELKRIRTV